ncbi:uncharacterized protein N7459_004527 [Penicillium hispanicum]|uniref:uncharacterized protein n=1 Tax=Penicillium hispanicum TaxID=1080232 RepID=UPI002541DECF|nr:uncharacterized protein N7459_004527 [Penicillium hispanicum]KAJ5584727.1 hypothetical protein N7459_004527 [Penicillium hispanicum]
MYQSFALLSLLTQCLAQTQVYSDLYNEFTRYTAFSAAAYTDSCETPPYRSSVATLFQVSQDKELVISFRGTSTPKDLDTGFQFSFVNLKAPGTKCLNCKVHAGFQAAYVSLAKQVTPEIQSQLSLHPDYFLVVTGHSLGAGIAAIGTAALTGLGRLTKTYTFGEPLNGDSSFAEYIESQVPGTNYFRVTYANDGVPQIPPTLLGFRHHGNKYWEKESDQNDATTTFMCGKQSTTSNLMSFYKLILPGE